MHYQDWIPQYLVVQNHFGGEPSIIWNGVKIKKHLVYSSLPETNIAPAGLRHPKRETKNPLPTLHQVEKTRC